MEIFHTFDLSLSSEIKVWKFSTPLLYYSYVEASLTKIVKLPKLYAFNARVGSQMAVVIEVREHSISIGIENRMPQ